MSTSREDRLATLETKLQGLLDRQAIFDCIKSYTSRHAFSEVELAASSHRLSGGDRSGRRRFSEAAERLKRLGPREQNVVMQRCEIDGDVADAESCSFGVFLNADGETGRFLARRCTDRLERRDGVWRITLRRTTVEISLEGQLTLPSGSDVPPGRAN